MADGCRSNIWDNGSVSVVLVNSVTTAPPFRAGSIRPRDRSSDSASLREGRGHPDLLRQLAFRRQTIARHQASFYDQVLKLTRNDIRKALGGRQGNRLEYQGYSPAVMPSGRNCDPSGKLIVSRRS